MARIQYVCLSDLHAGSAYSLLDDTSVPKAFGTAFGAFLERHHAQFLGNTAGGKSPEVIFMGDSLDMAFAELDTGVQAYQSFVQAALPTGLLSPNSRFLPGNHDQSLWSAAQTARVARQIAEGQGAALPDTTGAAPASAFEAPVLSALHARMGLGAVRTSYPNLILSNTDRAVVLHHGHFCEPLYRAVSILLGQVTGQPNRVLSAADLARENLAWITFGWSTSGEVASLAAELQALYADVYVSSRAHAVRRRMADVLTQLILTRMPRLTAAQDQSLRFGVTGAVDIALGSFSDSGRNSVLSALDAGALADLNWYLAGPVQAQLRAELPNLPQDISFVYGHTHKPYCGQVIPGNGMPVSGACNTGGWYLDSPMMNGVQGVALVLIDEALNTVWAPVFATPLNGQVALPPPRLVGRETPEGLAFRDQVVGWMDKDRALWTALRDAAARAYVAKAGTLYASDAEGAA